MGSPRDRLPGQSRGSPHDALGQVAHHDGVYHQADNKHSPHCLPIASLVNPACITLPETGARAKSVSQELECAPITGYFAVSSLAS
ncbi:hypothetical protein [Acerihabitans sp.]|uniref:hypothetical protein n=1 Tax=Acerihabitans sp. TaxID=2811394 RepID=UPI002ED9B36D